MPRYLIERTLKPGLEMPTDVRDADCRAIVACNAEFGVTWVYSYVAVDHKRTFCLYDSPSPEAIRSAAAKNNLPVDRITQVSAMTPFFSY